MAPVTGIAGAGANPTKVDSVDTAGESVKSLTEGQGSAVQRGTGAAKDSGLDFPIAVQQQPVSS